MQKHIDRGGQKMTVWFVVGFIVVATVVTLIAAVTSGGDQGGGNLPAPAVTAEDHVRGAQDAKVSLVEYADLQCPACRQVQPLLSQAFAEYGDRVLFVVRNFPLYSIHSNAGLSAQAAEAAALQGKYWEMHDLLYEKQIEWEDASPSRVVEQYFTGYAQSLGLDMDQFSRDIYSDQVLRRIQTDVDGANAIGVNSTPSFYTNLEKIQTPRGYDELKAILDAALADA